MENTTQAAEALLPALLPMPPSGCPLVPSSSYPSAKIALILDCQTCMEMVPDTEGSAFLSSGSLTSHLAVQLNLSSSELFIKAFLCIPICAAQYGL